MHQNFFITLYTDAGFSEKNKRARIAWRGKCSQGIVQSYMDIDSPDVHHAEMKAIYFAIYESLRKFPDLQGFFINCDNLGCVQAFWPFGKHRCPAPAKLVFEQIKVLVSDRWIRAKHVKGHSGTGNIRSYMNTYVDRMTRTGPPEGKGKRAVLTEKMLANICHQQEAGDED